VERTCAMTMIMMTTTTTVIYRRRDDVSKVICIITTLYGKWRSREEEGKRKMTKRQGDGGREGGRE